jgi:hypothetical protein
LAQAGSYGLAPKPPLDSTFFDTAIQLAASDTNIAEWLDELHTMLRLSDLGLPIPGDAFELKMEQFFADLYYELAHATVSYVWTAYVALVRLYTDVIAATTNRR